MARKMKDSGIAWIGDIPVTWKNYRHKHVMHKEKVLCEHYNGEDIISLTMNGVIIRDLDAGGKMPTTFDGYQYVEPEDLLLCLFDIDVTPRCVGLVKNYGLTSPAYSRFKVHEGFFNAYYNYLLRTIDDKKVFIHLSKNLRSSLTESDFGVLPTIAPPYEEQIRIATFLDTECARIDTVIEKTRTSIEEYKKLKQSVITHAVTKGIQPNRKMKDSGIEWIGEIPESYNVERIKHLGSYRNGLIYTPEQVVDEGHGILVLRSSNVQQGKLCFEDNVYVNTEIPERLMVQKGDIIICSRNGSRELIGKCAVVEDDMIASFGAFMMILRCDSPKYMYYILNSSVFKYYLSTFLTSTINQLTGGNFGNMAIVWCDNTDEQVKIVEYLDNETTKIDTLILQKETLLSELETYKKSLIFEFVTGKKEVPS